MGKNSAEYMRAYRARKRAARDAVERIGPLMAPAGDLFAALAMVGQLEEEVRHLKAELASRPLSPYTEVSSLNTDATRRAAQAQRDALLRKINRGG